MQPAPPPPPAPKPLSPPAPRRNTFRRFVVIVVLLAIAFLGGFVPQWLEVRKLGTELSRTDVQLRLTNAHRMLGVASQEAQRGNYPGATEAAARFFDDAATLARTDAFAQEQRTRVALLSYAAQRDEIMGLLSSASPAAQARLAGLYLTMNGVLERRKDEG